VNTHGKGRTGASPQELDMTLNFRGINDLLNNAMKFKQQYQRLTNPTAKPTTTAPTTTGPVKR
jgi:hypothetical protein